MFESVADLVAFVRTNTDNDIVDHPAWEKLTEANAHALDPTEDHTHDLAAFEEILANKPTAETVDELHRALAVVSSIGTVCELPSVTKFFNGNPVLGTVGGGVEVFSGRAGRKRWAEIEKIIAPRLGQGRSTRSTRSSPPPTSTAPPSEKAQAELDERRTRTRGRRRGGDRRRRRHRGGGRRRWRSRPSTKVLGGDEDFWARVGIDPVRVMTSSGTFFTLRCYLNDQPIFLGRNGRISVFPSERALARYLADEHDHDLSDLATYDDIKTAATDGSLRVDVSDDNVYVLTDHRRRPRRRPRRAGPRSARAGGRTAARHRRLLRGHRRGREARCRRRRWAASSAACSNPTPSTARARPTPTPSPSGSPWRGSSSPDCARSRRSVPFARRARVSATRRVLRQCARARL